MNEKPGHLVSPGRYCGQPTAKWMSMYALVASLLVMPQAISLDTKQLTREIAGNSMEYTE